MKHTLQYDQLSCRLRVEGLPDVSAGQAADAVGIITGWSLAWVGRPELEGRREHLLALMQVVLPYARHLISAAPRPFGEAGQPVAIAPGEAGQHRIELRSSQPDTPPLQVDLDQLRLDPRLVLPLPVPADRPLRARELSEREPLQRRLAAPVGGAAALATAAALALLLPPPPLPQPAGRPVPAASAPPAAR